MNELHDVLHDLRLALRGLRKSPGFTIVAVTVLALGIGANTAIFSVVDQVMLRPLPYPDAGRLTVVSDVQPAYGEAPMSYAEWQDLQENGRMFDALAAYYALDVNYAAGDLPERLRLLLVSPRYFAILGDTSIAGRSFTPDEEAPGGPPAVVASEWFWKTRLGGRSDAIGKVIHLSGKAYTLVGVIRDAGTPFVSSVAAYAPLAPNAPWTNRGSHYLRVLARLPAHADSRETRSEIAALAANLQRERGTDHGLRIHPLREALLGDTGNQLVLLFAAVGFVLLIAGANVGNLLLVRAANRRHEFALRRALGARVSHVIRQILAESLVLGLGGAVPGALVAAWGTSAVRRFLPVDLPVHEGVTLDLRALVYAALVGLLVAVVSGFVPVLIERRGAPLGEIVGGRVVGGSARSRRARHAVVVAELALSLVLLIGAGLMIKSFHKLLEVDPGFRPAGLLSLRMSLPEARYPSPQQRLEFTSTVISRLNRLTGVVDSAVASGLPFANGMNGDLEIEGHTFDPGNKPNAEKRIVSLDYFRVMGIPLRRGRLFVPSDRESSPQVVVVSEAMAQRVWPHEDPIGKRIRSLTCNDECWEQVVGVVGNVREAALGQPAAMEVYYPLQQYPLSGFQVVLRTERNPAGMVDAARRVVAGVDPLQPVYDIETMTRRVAVSLSNRRLQTLLLSSFAVLALVLAAVGVGGVVSYAIGQRTREIGVRIALGLRPSAAVGLLIKEGMRLTGWSVAAGLPVAFGLVHLLRAELYAVAPSDPISFAAGISVLGLAALVACYLPARRAARIDPMEALRNE